MLGQSVLLPRDQIPDDLMEFFEPAECGKCYICEMVAVFREVRRVLRDDGVMFLNLGDGYCSTAPGTLGDQLNQRGILAGVSDRRAAAARKFRPETPAGLKPKDLMMMPARVALALQADGWWLRSDIIWAKPNPMPESVTDRPTSAHEHVFLLTKSAKYFFDADAVRESFVDERMGASAAHIGTPEAYADAARGGGDKGLARFVGTTGRNIRNVWTIATAPFPGAHFATFPPELAEHCIKAGTSERGCCANCGAPWVRVVERVGGPQGDHTKAGRLDGADAAVRATGHSGRAAGTVLSARYAESGYPEMRTTGWLASCQCNAAVVPCVVLDCFAGAGTTGMVADRLGRNAVMVELSASYCDMMRARLIKDAGLFAEIAAE